MSLFAFDWNGFDQLRTGMERIFSDVFESGPRLLAGPWNGSRTFPALNVWEDGENLYAECELPGVRREDLETLVVGNELTVKGERRPAEHEGAAWHRRERDHGSFSRTLRLPTAVDRDKVQAELESGVLRVTLPKAREALPRKIEVKCLSR